VRALLQRVRRASVTIEDESVGSIDEGLLVFLGLQPGDSLEIGERLLERVLNYRVFSDEQGRMNRSLRNVSGGVLLVSQFTLAADTSRGLRPGFSTAMLPEEAGPLFAQLYGYLERVHAPVSGGCFGADMQVSLVNDGPVTFLLEAS